MTKTEKRALALVNEVRFEMGLALYEACEAINTTWFKALCRAIEQHEAFKQEVSDVCSDVRLNDGLHKLYRFIIAKPDPLVEALKQLKMSYVDAEDFRAALAARGGRIVWEGE